MNFRILFSILISFSLTLVYGQHTSVFINDIYDLEWCQNSKVKTIQSMNDNFTLENGVPISDIAKSVSYTDGKKTVNQVFGNGSFSLSTTLSSDFKRIHSTSLGPSTTKFYYDAKKSLAYKISEVSISGIYQVEEFIRGADGKVIQKTIYNYDSSIMKFESDLAKLQSIDRKLTQNWKYSYDEDGVLSEVMIQRYSSHSEQLESTMRINIEYKNNLPSSLEITEINGGKDSSKGKREFGYTLFE